MAALARITVAVRDTRWFREVAARLGDLLDALDDEDLSPRTQERVDALRRVMGVARPEDDLPEP